MRAGWSVLLIAAGVLPAGAQPVLVKDVDPSAPQLGRPTARAFTDVAGAAYFAGSDGVDGTQLWRWTLGATPPALVRVLAAQGGGISAPVAVGNLLYFRASDGATGTELWKSDGTAAGTRLVRDIAPGRASSGASGSYAALGSILYFVADDGVSGPSVWRTDGTTAGTRLVADTDPTSPTQQSPSGLRAMNGFVYFIGNGVGSATLSQNQLWRTDGTTAQAVSAFPPGGAPAGILGVIGTSLYYLVGSRDLWTTTGATAGSLVATLPSTPRLAVVQGSLLFFLATSAAAGEELWRSDGTAAGTRMVSDQVAGTQGAAIAELVPHNALVYFTAATPFGNPPTMRDVWRSDGMTTSSASGGWPFTLLPEGRRITQLTSGGRYLVTNFDVNGQTPQLWRGDGNALGWIELLRGAGPLTTATRVADRVLFTNANSFAMGATDGTPVGTAMLPATVRPDPDVTTILGPAVAGGALYFGGNEPTARVEPWKSDGTAAGTALVGDVHSTDSSYPQGFVTLGERVYFIATPNDNIRSLMTVDAGAVRRVRQSSLPSFTDSVLALPGRLLVVANQPATGIELWQSDGTDAGTRLLVDINPGAASSGPGGLVRLGERALFVASDGGSGAELWQSDGTAAGTSLVKDIRPGAMGSSLTAFVVSGARLFFLADDGTSGQELWVSDGSPAGTARVADLVAGSGSATIRNLTAFRGGVLFSATTAAAGTEIWHSDGTMTGTQQLADVAPGAASSNPSSLAAAGTVAYFAATSDISGSELWRTDGSPGGTMLVRDIMPGIQSSSPRSVVAVSPTGRALFVAHDDAGGELWQTDGSAAGTMPAGEVVPGPASAGARPLALVGSRLLFTAERASEGTALWALPLGFDSTPPVITPALTGTLGSGGFYTSDVRVSWQVSDPDSLVSSTLNCDVTTVASDTSALVITCRAWSVGGLGTASVTVRRDATAPALICPADIYQPDGPAAVSFAAPSATDSIDPAPTVSVDATSGASFPLGATTVTATARDAAGNQSTCRFTVTLGGPPPSDAGTASDASGPGDDAGGGADADAGAGPDGGPGDGGADGCGCRTGGGGRGAPTALALALLISLLWRRRARRPAPAPARPRRTR